MSLLQIKDLGVKAGVVLNPATPLSTIQYVISQVDLILLMSGEVLYPICLLHCLRYRGPVACQGGCCLSGPVQAASWRDTPPKSSQCCIMMQAASCRAAYRISAALGS